MNKGNKGFTLVEAMVSVMLLAVGITSSLAAFAHLTAGWRQVQDSEAMAQLAYDKYDELVATGALTSDSLDGDFTDRGIDAYQWEASVENTGVDNLSALTVTVEARDAQSAPQSERISGLVFIPPAPTQPTDGGTP